MLDSLISLRIISVTDICTDRFMEVTDAESSICLQALAFDKYISLLFSDIADCWASGSDDEVDKEITRSVVFKFHSGYC